MTVHEFPHTLDCPGCIEQDVEQARAERTVPVMTTDGKHMHEHSEDCIEEGCKPWTTDSVTGTSQNETHTHLGGNVPVSGSTQDCSICNEWRGFKPLSEVKEFNSAVEGLRIAGEVRCAICHAPARAHNGGLAQDHNFALPLVPTARQHGMLDEDPSTIAFFRSGVENLTQAVCDTSIALIRAREKAEELVRDAETEQRRATQDLHNHIHDFMGTSDG